MQCLSGLIFVISNQNRYFWGFLLLSKMLAFLTGSFSRLLAFSTAAYLQSRQGPKMWERIRPKWWGIKQLDWRHLERKCHRARPRKFAIEEKCNEKASLCRGVTSLSLPLTVSLALSELPKPREPFRQAADELSDDQIAWQVVVFFLLRRCCHSSARRTLWKTVALF